MVSAHAPELAWGVFALANLVVMLILDEWQTVPFHLIWLSLSILYGFRMWSIRSAVIVLCAVMLTTGFALILPVIRAHQGLGGIDESTEVPLMAAIFVAMVWHARRRRAAMVQTEGALERERDAVGRLEALDEMKNTFLQAVSHDLRTPLTAVMGGALTLQRAEELGLSSDESTDLLARLAMNARKLNRLLTDLLDLDRLNRGIVAPVLSPTDLGALGRSVAESLDISPARKLQIDVKPVVIAVDPSKVERIIENLLVNASRHTTEGTTIWLRVRPEVDGALILVEDDGPGVPEDFRGAIFEQFQQGPGGGGHAPGSGIGLSLVGRFAEIHGGRAWVEERPGGGASFRVFVRDGYVAEATAADAAGGSRERPVQSVGG
jgi:signal transduction histidine kinase